MPTEPAWLLPAPVRRSRFVADAPRWRAWNIEVALDRIAPFDLARRKALPVLFLDYQTQLEGGAPGRHGSGRGGVFRGYYIKGVGRTQAAANWNDPSDRYHGSGYMSVSSAMRERLITVALQARGLGDAIVPCETILIGRIRPEERRSLAGAEATSPPLSPYDARFLALSLKPANFARMSNFMWALNHFSISPQWMGNLFLDFERYLHPPDEREGLSGEPAAIALAMDGAFRRGLANFRRFERAGLFWIYTQNNFTLDGRYVDLETPMFIGSPFLGVFQQEHTFPVPFRLLGFEAFAFVLYWRLFLRWLDGKLRFLTARSVLSGAMRPFLQEVKRQIGQVFAPAHLLRDDGVLKEQAVANLCAALDPGRQARSRLTELADLAFVRMMRGVDQPLPDWGWREIDFRPAPISTTRFRITAPAFIQPCFSEQGTLFADALAKIGAERDPGELLGRVAANCRRLQELG